MSQVTVWCMNMCKQITDLNLLPDRRTDAIQNPVKTRCMLYHALSDIAHSLLLFAYNLQDLSEANSRGYHHIPAYAVT
jgi:hypothetical protein